MQNMRQLLALLVLLLMVQFTYAQTGAITGKVLDKNGQPVEGASVIIKGTPAGTATSQDGSFSLNAKKGDILVISAINFTNKEVKIDNETSYNVALDPQENVVNEVVVTAL